jgi:ABC-type lipoprotein release transport system permease subunit
MNRKLIFGAALVGCVVVALTIVFASTRNSGEVSLENNSSEPIAHATIEVCGQKLDFSEMARGEIKTAKFKVKGDSQYDVIISFHSGRKINAHIGYVTNGASYKDKLAVTDNEVVLETSPTIR